MSAARILRAHWSRGVPTLRRHPCRRSLQIGRPNGWCAITAMGKSGVRTTRHPREGATLSELEGSRARMPGSRVVHRAQEIGGRMPPVLRDSGGPEGRQKPSQPLSGFRKPSPHEAGVELACPTSLCEPQDAASTRDTAVTERPSAPTSILRLRRHGCRRSVGRPLSLVINAYIRIACKCKLPSPPSGAWPCTRRCPRVRFAHPGLLSVARFAG